MSGLNTYEVLRTIKYMYEDLRKMFYIFVKDLIKHLQIYPWQVLPGKTEKKYEYLLILLNS